MEKPSTSSPPSQIAYHDAIALLAEAIRDGQKTKIATRDEVFRILQGKS
jgi:hypothetical protein